MFVKLVMNSRNRKTGPIPVSTTEENSCPNECSLKGNECYARFSYLRYQWAKVSKVGDNWSGFCKRITKFATGTLWRHNQAGDLPQNKKGKIHKTKLIQFLKAAKHTRCWTYTHYDPKDSHNAECIRLANESITVNLSADNKKQADEYYDLNIGPVVVILPEDAPLLGNKTPKGRQIVVCPAQKTEITCADCQLCQLKRKSIIGFLAHGVSSKRLSERV